MNIDIKSSVGRVSVALCGIFLLVVAAVLIYFFSPFNSANITDADIVSKGAEYNVKLKGISEYNTDGFTVATDGFYITTEKQLVYVDEDGYARTTDEGNGEIYLSGKFNSGVILYDKYSFCSDKYNSVQALEEFFETPDRIYNFDINNLSDYVQDIINYKKKFYGTAKVRIYRGRCVFTEIYIEGDKILEIKI